TSMTASKTQTSVAASLLFSANDPDGETITQYALWDTQGNGYWVVNGAAQPTGVEIDITAAQLPQTFYVFGSASDTLYARASDGTAWGAWTQFTASPLVDHAPVVTATDFTWGSGQTLAASSLFTVSDADGDSITKYSLWDTGGNGRWVVNGVAQVAN